MNHVRRVDEIDTSVDQPAMCRFDVRNAQIDQRFGAWLIVGLREHESRSATIEEGDAAERVQMIQAEHIAVPALGSLDVGH